MLMCAWEEEIFFKKNLPKQHTEREKPEAHNVTRSQERKFFSPNIMFEKVGKKIKDAKKTLVDKTNEAEYQFKEEPLRNRILLEKICDELSNRTVCAADDVESNL
jgi:hypothetical protein